jgi:hypothetical protein
MSEPILTEVEQRLLKAAVFTEYSRVWGVPKQQEYLVVCRVVEVMGKIMAESVSLDA